MVRKPHKRPHYLEQIVQANALGMLKPGFNQAIVYHDDWCDLLTGKGACNCNAEVEIIPGSVQ